MPPRSALDSPVATYRLQLSRDFTFDAAAALAPYPAELGISHVYASPFLKARAGSTHGYDIVDHNQLNPELGGRESFDALCARLRQHDMGLILDFLPNHTAIGRDDNPLVARHPGMGRCVALQRIFRHRLESAPPGARRQGAGAGPRPALWRRARWRRDRVAFRSCDGQPQLLALRASLSFGAGGLSGGAAGGAARTRGRRAGAAGGGAATFARGRWHRGDAGGGGLPSSDAWRNWRGATARWRGSPPRSPPGAASRTRPRASPVSMSCCSASPIGRPIGASPPTRSTIAVSSTSAISPASGWRTRRSSPPRMDCWAS